jgi:hypothetical protein
MCGGSVGAPTSRFILDKLDQSGRMKRADRSPTSFSGNQLFANGSRPGLACQVHKLDLGMRKAVWVARDELRPDAQPIRNTLSIREQPSFNSVNCHTKAH